MAVTEESLRHGGVGQCLGETPNAADAADRQTADPEFRHASGNRDGVSGHKVFGLHDTPTRSPLPVTRDAAFRTR
jgi:hypothetical protein